MYPTYRQGNIDTVMKYRKNGCNNFQQKNNYLE